MSSQEVASLAAGPSAPARWLRHGMMGAMYLFLVSCFVSIAVNSIALGAMALCWVGLMIAERKRPSLATPLDYFFLAYLVAEVLATLFSVNVPQSLYFSRRLLLIGIVYFFGSQVDSERTARSIMLVLLATAAVVASIGVVKMLAAKPDTVMRLGIFQFYMTTSELMMIALLLILPFVVHAGTPLKVRVAAAVALIPVAVALYGTVTRGAYLAAGAGILCIAFVRNKWLLVPFVLLLIVMVVFAPPYVEHRLASIVDLHHPENASRLLLWSNGWKIFADHPVVGVGDIDLGALLVQYHGGPLPEPWGHLHNIFMQVLVTLGVVGAAAVVAMFVRIAMVEWRIYRRAKDHWLWGSVSLGALAVFVGFQVNGLTEWSFGDQEVVILFWITVGMALAVGRLAATSVKGS